MLLILLTLVATLGTAAGGIGSFLYWRENHSDRATQKQEDRITHALHPYDVRLIELELTAKHSADAIAAAITRSLQPLVTSMASLETKMDVLWELQRQAALDAARILHHPEKAREKIDHLLDAFSEDTLTSEEEVQLRKYLVIIRDWEPDQDAGFPVYQGEQTAAATLLGVLKYLWPNRKDREGTSADE